MTENTKNYHGECRGLFQALQRAIKAGASTAELHKLAEEMIPSSPDSPNNVSYRCLLCQDTGAVLVWSNETIHAVMKGAEYVPRKRCSLRCSCSANRRWSEDFPIYEPARWCRFTGYDKLDEVKAWCETYQIAKAERLLGEFCGSDESDNMF